MATMAPFHRPPPADDAARPTRAFAELSRRRRAQHPLAVLTDHQLAVALLVAEGLDNTQIGRRLWVTRRTVEFHLTNIYRALGVTTRLQLAALIAAGGQPGSARAR